MLNIIRSLNYSARRDTVIWITILTMLILPVFILFLAGILDGESLSNITPSVYFASQNMATVFLFQCFAIMIFSSKLVASDAGDKTINYEFLAGHSRNRIFIGRMIAGIVWGAGLVFLLMIIPFVYLYLLNGWGPETDMGNVLIRCALVFFPILRICSLSIMLSCVSRSAGKGIALSYAIFMIVVLVTSIFQDLLEIKVTYSTGMTNAEFLLVSENARYVISEGRKIQLYDTAVTGEMVWKTISVSLIFSALYLIIAYVNFKKKDRD